MRIVDVHCHLDLYEKTSEHEFDLDTFVDVQKKAGVQIIITNGVSPESNRLVLDYAKKYDTVKAALGFYPTHVLEYSEQAFLDELRFIEQQKQNIVAIGEVGLDAYHIKDKLDIMKKAFTQIVELAQRMDKPIIVHSRNAEVETVELLEKIGYPKVVMHCFGGRKHLIKRIISNGWYFTIPCTVVKLQHFQSIVELCPSEKLLTETDGPYLSPYTDIPRNESRFIANSLAKIAAIKGLDPEEVANMIFLNYQRLFT